MTSNNSKIITTSSILIYFFLVSCSNTNNINPKYTYITTKNTYLYWHIANNNKNYPYTLSKHQIYGADGVHLRNIGAVPVGTFLNVDSMKSESDFYFPTKIQIRGHLKYEDEWIGFKCSIRENEFHDFFRLIE